jgi:hypothetical protein
MKTLSLKDRETWLDRADLIKKLNARNEQRKQDISDLFRLTTGRATKSRAKNDAGDAHLTGVQAATSWMRGNPESVRAKLHKMAKFLRRKIHKK